MPTGDRWKAHRKLVADTMSPAFLGGVAGPQMWKSTMKLIDLWRVKERLAKGRPFSVSTDIRKAAFEIIWAATFGFDSGLSFLRRCPSSPIWATWIMRSNSQSHLILPSSKQVSLSMTP
ncbi:hypothetical protein LB505_008614 [Fusarium chuoi]|nr:hypothetical protein LB505_008614 [Fusarium chuoi]